MITHIWFDLQGTLVSTPDQDNVGPVLAELKKIVPLSIATNADRDEVVHEFDRAHIDSNLFTHIITIEDVARGKPASDMFNEIIARASTAANELLYVGDNLTTDIYPAGVAGMQTCLLWNYSDQATYSCEQFHDLLTLITNKK